MTSLKYFKSPWLELIIMLAAVAFSFVGLSIISYLSQLHASGGMSYSMIALWLLAFFLISFSIAMVAVMAGIGGGIIPLFVLPWLSGQVIGGCLGSLALVKAKVTVNNTNEEEFYHEPHEQKRKEKV